MTAICASCTHELFRSAAAKEALGVGQSEWVVEQCTVSEDGRPSCCTGQLQVISAADVLFPPSALLLLRIKGRMHGLCAIGTAHQQCMQQTFHKADIETLGCVLLLPMARRKHVPHDFEGSAAYLETV